MDYIIQVAELASLAQLLPPCSPTVRNPAPDSSLKSCFSPIASASAAARHLRPLQLLLPGPIAASASTAAPRLPPPPAAAPRIAPTSAAARRFHDQLLLPISSASTATPRLHPLQLLLPDCVRFNCCSPDCVCFNCCSPIAYWIPAHARAQYSQTFFAEFEVQ